MHAICAKKLLKRKKKVKLTKQHQMLHIQSDDQVEHLAEYWVVDRKVLLQLLRYKNIE